MATLAESLAIAVQHHQAGRLQTAENIYRDILANDPNHPDAQHLLGVVFFQLGDLDKAVQHISRAVELNGAIAKFHSNLGNVFQAQRRLNEAVTSFHRALQIDPQFAEAYLNLGSALQEQDRFDEAIDAYRCALKFKPDAAEAWTNLGLVLMAQGELDQAAAAFDSALKHNPDYADAHGNRALLRLLYSDFEYGWPEYEWRWKSTQLEQGEFAQPRWDGSPLFDRTILLHAEQGLGDTIQFIRYTTLIKQNNPAARIIVECQRPLTNLLARVSSIDQLIAAGDPLPPYHFHSPLLSLPGIFRTSATTVPTRIPYCFADSQHVAHWRDWLKNCSGLRVGINWQGRSGDGEFRKRNIPVECFSQLSKLPNVRLISLQKREGQLTSGTSSEHLSLLDPGADFDSSRGAFMDTAAIMMNLDLVITSDTSVPHLTGALGVPVWVALPYVPDWRWMLNRSDSPWYPTMRLFRQKKPGDWKPVFEEIKNALRHFASSD